MEKNTPYLVIVEDNPDDSFWLKRELKKAGIGMCITLIADGKTAIDFFSECDVFPIVLFLDMHLPGASGLELLRYLKHNSMLEKMSVFVLDGSSLPKEIQECEDLDVLGFLEKPVTVEDLSKLVLPQIAAENKS